jgi:hypothetical protein
MFDNHKHVHQTKGCRRRHEEIAGDNPPSVQTQEGRLASITHWPTSRMPGKILIDGSGRYPNPGLQQQRIGDPFLPHDGFSFAIRRISARNSAGMGGRPGRYFILQNSLQPARCQRINVARLTTISASGLRNDLRNR